MRKKKRIERKKVKKDDQVKFVWKKERESKSEKGGKGTTTKKDWDKFVQGKEREGRVGKGEERVRQRDWVKPL